MSLLKAALNLSVRHQELTGADQQISVKTLDDYAEKITISNEAKTPLDLELCKDEPVSVLRNFCKNLKSAKQTREKKTCLQ